MSKISSVLCVTLFGVLLAAPFAMAIAPELSNSGSSSGNRCVVVPQVELDCTGAFLENEPLVVGEDVVNGACNSVPYVAQEMNEHICGTMYTFYYEDNDGDPYNNDKRDTDWYEFTLDVDSRVIATAMADTELDFNFYYVGNGDRTHDCAGVSILLSADNPVDNETSLDMVLEAGDYWLWIGPGDFGPAYMPFEVEYSIEVEIVPLEVAAADLQAEAFVLGQNYPNPFNPTTSISYSLPLTSEVQLSVFNMSGERVASLVNGVQESGAHEISFDAGALPSGVYFYTLQAEGLVQTRKMVLLK